MFMKRKYIYTGYRWMPHNKYAFAFTGVAMSVKGRGDMPMASNYYIIFWKANQHQKTW